MFCRIYTQTGQLLTEGACGLRRDGALEVVPLRSRRPLQAGEGPLVVVEGPRRYPVRVTAAHAAHQTAARDRTVVYHLTSLAR